MINGISNQRQLWCNLIDFLLAESSVSAILLSFCKNPEMSFSTRFNTPRENYFKIRRFE